MALFLLLAGLVISRPSLAAVTQLRTGGVTGLEVVDLNKSTHICGGQDFDGLSRDDVRACADIRCLPE